MRERKPGYITQQVDNNFGLEVKVNRLVKPEIGDMPSSGDPVPEGQFFEGESLEKDRRFREVIPPGKIGSSDGEDLDTLTPPQYIDTKPYMRGEQNAPELHGSVNVQKVSRRDATAFQTYSTFQPRTWPMPRAAQDQVYLEGYGRNAADPRMTDEDAKLGLQTTDRPDRANLYQDDRDGVLHNINHPGFSAVQSKIEGEGYSAKSAGAILAAKTREASPAAKKENPNLKRVRG